LDIDREGHWRSTETELFIGHVSSYQWTIITWSVSCTVIDVFFIACVFYIVYSCYVSTVLCHITVVWTPFSATILALVLQLYERNKLKLKLFQRKPT